MVALVYASLSINLMLQYSRCCYYVCCTTISACVVLIYQCINPHCMYIRFSGTDFSAVPPTLIRKITFPSHLAVVLVWSVPASVADDVDGFVISVVMVTASGPSTIQRSTAGKRVRAYAVYFLEKGASYQVTVHMMMNGLHSGPLTVEVKF